MLPMADRFSPAASPTEINLSPDRRTLTVHFDTGEITPISAELLRVESPSAEVQGHAPDQKTTPSGKRLVTITDIQPVGHYAIRIIFSDGHDTGIFSWDILHRYGREAETLLAAYAARLDDLGLSRDG